MHRVAAFAFSALLLAAPTAFAEDRGAQADDGRQAVGEVRLSDSAPATRPNDAVLSGPQARALTLSACGGQQASASCQGAGRTLVRNIDWNDVGPSTDDFALSEDSLSLRGARLVGTFRF